MDCKHTNIDRQVTAFVCKDCGHSWFRCILCKLPAYPAGHAEAGGLHGESRWVSDESGYCITCNPNDNYAKPTRK